MSYPLLSISSVPLVWSQVSEPNGGEGDEAEVGTVQEAPTLPHLEQECSSNDVTEKNSVVFSFAGRCINLKHLPVCKG